ncbi:MAG: sigma-70 family RNA polymerase sigma factor [Phycisphaerae bacterium]|nr:sigma-70 family RNA polymerase sigma factor [Phycisphaerae bacterium]
MTDDTCDLTAAAAGDGQAFARLYDRHAGVVLSLCRRRASSEAEAEDATQETFVRAFRMLDQLDRPAGFRRWLYAIARRVCAERHRAARRRAHHEEQAVISRIDLSPPAIAAAESVSQAEQLERLGLALDALADEERLAIHLYYLDADPVEAAASTLGLSRGGFYKLLARARRRLATLMGEVPTP